MHPPVDMDAAQWRQLLSQNNRLISVHTALPDALLVQSFSGFEAINQDLELTLECLSVSPDLDTLLLPGTALALQLATADGKQRLWQCVVTEVQRQEGDGGLWGYRLIVGSWLGLLKQRRNLLIFQNRTVPEIVAQVFADYPQANWREQHHHPLARRALCTQYRESDFEFVTRILAEAGLSFRFEHAESVQFDSEGHPIGSAKLVIFDTIASWPEGSTLPFGRSAAGEKDHVISHFSERRQLVSNAAHTLRWNPVAVQAIAGETSLPSVKDQCRLPTRAVLDVQPPEPLNDHKDAVHYAHSRMLALSQEYAQFHGQGAVRHLQIGLRYELSGHQDLSRQPFVCSRIEHLATNNLRVNNAGLFSAATAEHGTYSNRFIAAPAAVRILPPRAQRPLACGLQSATVVGVDQQALTSNREHQIRVQFYWQRGPSPLRGGLKDTDSLRTPDGHAPGDQRSGIWLRVAETMAGANFGQRFTPRIGSEVAIAFEHGDIDQPVVTAQLYNAAAPPPYAAGDGTQANHPGTVSGLKTQDMQGAAASQWLLDDANGQARHELRNAAGNSHLALGYLIEQSDTSRGSYRGEGFAQTSDSWGTLRANEGLLLSASHQISASSTQMDIGDALSQFKAGVETAERLDLAAQQIDAGHLSANPAQRDLSEALDPQLDARFPNRVNNQDATQPDPGQRSGSTPVQRLREPQLIMETPSHLILTTPNTSIATANEHLHLTSQGDSHLVARQTLAGVSGDSLHLHTASGGANLIAQNGDISLRAHDDSLQILADQSFSAMASNERIDILAKQRIVLQAGDSQITLEGRNVTFSCPGSFTAKGKQHPILHGENTAASLPVFPDGQQAPTLKLAHRYQDLTGVGGAPYTVLFSNGQLVKGLLDDNGEAAIDNPHAFASQVEYGEDASGTPDHFVLAADNPPAQQTPETEQDVNSARESFAQQRQAHLQDYLFDDEIDDPQSQGAYPKHARYAEYEQDNEAESGDYRPEHPTPRPEQEA